ncbi:MAG: hypothetical protein IIV94_03065 [Clostridiales bacterium]|nr:hypothetical protein [Clostridiales bacterium]
MFEIYIGKNKQGKDKKYIVADYAAVRGKKAWHSFIEYGRKFFKCSLDHIKVHTGYVYKDDLYLDNPAKPGSKLVSVLTYVK